jgi:K+-transporting ATPase ATPase B chain
MFVVEVGSVLTTVRFALDAAARRPGLGFELQITFWLWLTVLFANFAEAMAEGRGKAQADTLRKARTETTAKSAKVRLKPDTTDARRRRGAPGVRLGLCSGSVRL